MFSGTQWDSGVNPADFGASSRILGVNLFWDIQQDLGVNLAYFGIKQARFGV